MRVLLPMLLQNGGIGMRHWPRAAMLVSKSLLTSPLRYLEYREWQKVESTVTIHPAPIFIIGFWASGGHVLQNILACDQALGSPSLLQCMIPSLFLTMEEKIRRGMVEQSQSTRMVDSYPIRIDGPHTEDYAMAQLSHVSGYHGYVFPKSMRKITGRAILFENMSEEAIQVWESAYIKFLYKVAYAIKRPRLLLRNHSLTGQIPRILRHFPEAKFIHVYRNPYEVLEARVKGMQALMRHWSFQEISVDELTSNILDLYQIIMRRYLDNIHVIPQDNLIEIRFEDYRQHPIECLKQIYSKFQLAEFDKKLPAFRQYARAEKGLLNGEGGFIPDNSIKLVNQNWKFALDHWDYPCLDSQC